jgi:hypothetical protein
VLLAAILAKVLALRLEADQVLRETLTPLR